MEGVIGQDNIVLGRVAGKILFGLFFLTGLIFMAAGRAFAYDVTPTSVTLRWTAPGDDGRSGQATEYDLRCSVYYLTPAEWERAVRVFGEPKPLAAGTIESCTVTGLLPGVTYYFALRSADEAMNWSVLSNVVTITTPVPKTGLTPISDLAAQAGDAPGSLRLTWTVPEQAAWYQIYYSQDSIGENNLPSAMRWPETPDGSCGDFRLEGLEPGMFYWAAAIYFDALGKASPLSNVASASSGAGPGTDADNLPVPVEFALHQNYPNPFNPVTTVEFSLGKGGPVALEIFNVVGQKVITLVDEISTPGTHSVVWDGTDAEGRPAASGVYFYRLRSPEGCEVKRMLLLK